MTESKHEDPQEAAEAIDSSSPSDTVVLGENYVEEVRKNWETVKDASNDEEDADRESDEGSSGGSFILT